MARVTHSVRGGDLPGLAKLRQLVNEANRRVLVGVPVGAGNEFEEKADGSKVDSGVSLATVAAANEFGTEDGRVPERSFLREGLRRATPRFERLNRLNLRLILLGEQTPERALGQLGAFAAGAVQDFITHGKFQPNEPSTLAAKFPKTHPLENTGQLKQGISFVVEPKGAR